MHPLPPGEGKSSAHGPMSVSGSALSSVGDTGYVQGPWMLVAAA
ncbi:hypothetical protein [Archangium violaceum]|nr:hypothetical protein [Archangium violaceum]